MRDLIAFQLCDLIDATRKRYYNNRRNVFLRLCAHIIDPAQMLTIRRARAPLTMADLIRRIGRRMMNSPIMMMLQSRTDGSWVSWRHGSH